MPYLWLKALHIVFIASWFAGLFYLPRLFVNLAMVEPDSHAERERLLLMAAKLQRFSHGLMLIALLSGLGLWLGYDLWSLRSGQDGPYAWLHAKLTLVAAVVGYHIYNQRLLGQFKHQTNQRSHRWFRVYNEGSVLLFAAIVVLVVIKPF